MYIYGYWLIMELLWSSGWLSELGVWPHRVLGERFKGWQGGGGGGGGGNG